MDRVVLQSPAVMFLSREDAISALNELESVIKDYGCASVEDFLDICALPTSYEDSLYGWNTLQGAEVIEREDGFELCLPEKALIKSFTETSRNSRRSSTAGTSVDHPNHYQSESGLEAIDVIEAFTVDLTGVEAFDTGNALKYLCRWKKKNGVEDLKKAQWYINHLIKHVENLKEENSND